MKGQLSNVAEMFEAIEHLIDPDHKDGPAVYVTIGYLITEKGDIDQPIAYVACTLPDGRPEYAINRDGLYLRAARAIALDSSILDNADAWPTWYAIDLRRQARINSEWHTNRFLYSLQLVPFRTGRSMSIEPQWVRCTPYDRQLCELLNQREQVLHDNRDADERAETLRLTGDTLSGECKSDVESTPLTTPTETQTPF